MKKIYIHIIIAILFVSGSVAAYAQNGFSVTGTVKDEQGVAVIGAAVTLESDNSIGTVADENGNYKIDLPKGKAKIKVSSIGYSEQVIDVAERHIINIVLQEDSALLDEVVVIGYGSMRRSDLTGSVSSVKIDDETASVSTSFDQLLSGRAAGVDITNASASPDAPAVVRVRGITSLNGSNEPLYVIDGVILSNPENSSLVDSEVESNGLMGINPNDIASMEVLKDASATAIFGAAGANGVILITTKQAAKEKPTIRFNVGYDIQTPYKKFDMLSTDEYFEFLAKKQDLGVGDIYTQRYLDAWNEGKYMAVNWQDFTMNSAAPRKRIYFSVSGKPKNLAYNLSLGYNNTDGLIKTTDNRQITARLNVDKIFSKSLRVGTKVNFAYINSHNQQGATSKGLTLSSSLLRSMLVFRPFDLKPEYRSEDDDYDTLGEDEAKSGPASWLSDAITTREEFRITPSLYVEYKILPWLVFKSQIGGDYRVSGRGQWKGDAVNRASGGSVGSINETENYKWNWDNTLSVNKSFGRHNISSVLGMTMGRTGMMYQRVNANNISQDALWLDNINASYQTQFNYNEAYSTDASFFLRAVYNYADRYLVTATYRADGSSKFKSPNKFGHFPSVALAWRLNKEPWFRAPLISMAKIRLAYGRVGNSALSNYQTYTTYTNTNYTNHFADAGYTTGVAVNVFTNENLKWETTEQYSGGIDYGMFKGRLTLSVDAYYKNTFDLLQQRYMPLASGFQTRWMNCGVISNRGVEISLEATPVRTKLVEWQIGGNLSVNRNRLEKIGFDVDGIDVIMGDGSKISGKYYYGLSLGNSVYLSGEDGIANIFIEGQELGLFYGYKTDGIIQEDQVGIPTSQGGAPRSPGQINYVDLNGNGYLDRGDRTIIGNPNGKFNYGFNTTLSIENFRLAIAFQGVYGRDIYNANLASDLDNNYISYNVRTDAYRNAWTPERPSNKYMKLGGWDNTERYYSTDRYIEDGSYLRISSIAASYNFHIAKKFFIRDITVACSVNNPVVFTKYSGWDPNVSSFGNSMQRMGIDIGSYPSARVWCFDVKFTF